MSNLDKYTLNTVIDGIPNDEYHAIHAVSSSNCKDLLKSPWLYWHNKNNPKAQTPAMALGSMVHHLILEPSTFEDHYLVAEIPKRVTKAGKEAYAELEQQAQGRVLVDMEAYNNAKAMQENLYKNEFIKMLLSDGKAEQTTLWHDESNQTLCKAKADYLNTSKGLIVDLKTTSSLASEMAFKSTLNSYQYHLSASMYQDGSYHATGKRMDFYFIVVETFAPFNFGIYKLGDEWLRQGKSLYQEALRAYENALAKGTFEQPHNDGYLVELVA